MPLPIDVVSVQSQVVYGRVGNNVAIPTLGAFGLSAAAVPTVALSNTPHDATLHGGAVPVEWFEGWLDDLVARGGLRDLRAVLTGYLGNAAQSRVLARWIRERLEYHPELIDALRITRDAHCAELLLPPSTPERCGHADVSVREVAAAPAS
ncbi:MAG: hypothetical protein ACREPJ_15755 [Rhodanobacteraceae bacterium]